MENKLNDIDMINPKTLKKDFSILNSEGDILRLYIDNKNNYYFGSRLINNEGTIFYPVTEEQIKDYVNSNILLRDVFLQSDTDEVKILFKKAVKTALKQEYVDLIDSGNQLYFAFHSDLKKNEFEEKFR